MINRLFLLLLTLLFLLASLVGCDQPVSPQYTPLNLGIPKAALQSPVKGTLPDSTVLHIGITFKIDPRVLNQIDSQRLQPGQSSNLDQFARHIGINDSIYQKIKGFFNVGGVVLKLSKLRTHLSVQAKD
jgi:hypothetical protein